PFSLRRAFSRPSRKRCSVAASRPPSWYATRGGGSGGEWVSSFSRLNRPGLRRLYASRGTRATTAPLTTPSSPSAPAPSPVYRVLQALLEVVRGRNLGKERLQRLALRLALPLGEQPQMSLAGPRQGERLARQVGEVGGLTVLAHDNIGRAVGMDVDRQRHRLQ